MTEELDAPVVVVGIPTYNRVDRLARAVGSVLEQDHPSVEVVVSDNASTDGTVDLLDRLAAGHPSIRVVRQRTNIGPTANFRAVAAEVGAPYFQWLGDDDWIDPSYVSRCCETLEADRSLVLVAGRARYHAPDRVWDGPDQVVADQGDPADRVVAYFRQVRANGVFYGVARTAALQRVPPLDNRMGGDWLHLAAMAFLGGVRTIDEVTVHRAVGGATTSLAEVARRSGLGWLSRNAPQLAIAGNVLRDIGWTSPVYRELGWRRVLLGLRCAAVVLRRFLPEATAKFVRLQLRRLRPAVATSGGGR